jgi:uncharacterized protein YndB with AHSA1/START domain
MSYGTLTVENSISTLTFERRFRHPVAKVWRAITDPAELSQWWPAAVQMEFRPGGAMRFTFPDNLPETSPDGRPIEVTQDEDDPNNHGTILEIEHERVFVIDWNGETMRMELRPEPDGCTLVFTHVFAKPGAADFATGWHICLNGLERAVEGRPQPDDRFAGMQELHADYEKRLAETGLPIAEARR